MLEDAKTNQQQSSQENHVLILLARSGLVVYNYRFDKMAASLGSSSVRLVEKTWLKVLFVDLL
jgi:hypothetical protein